MFKNLKITCDQATTICDKNQYGEATIADKLKLMLHFLSCKICSLYTKQNNTLTKIYKSHSKSCKKSIPCLSEEEKMAFKISLQEKKG
ncbi:hypothetical protein [uncultured Polaribacter sp.]|uniref:hypothetical protein n=1 Tax=uncultured Polaribacter sp. TaxID=174711 RepID=UPI0026311BEA|nr:hypothetical protein [uncultured Polaribacter sp.]